MHYIYVNPKVDVYSQLKAKFYYAS